MAKKGQKFKKYSPEFKLSVILDMREHGLGYKETARKYELVKQSMGGAIYTLHRWERIYLEEGADGFMKERRGRSPKAGRAKKKPLPPEVEQDFITELQQLKERNEWLEMENEYLKKLNALVQAEEKNGRKPK